MVVSIYKERASFGSPVSAHSSLPQKVGHYSNPSKSFKCEKGWCFWFICFILIFEHTPSNIRAKTRDNLKQRLTVLRVPFFVLTFSVSLVIMSTILRPSLWLDVTLMVLFVNGKGWQPSWDLFLFLGEMTTRQPMSTWRHSKKKSWCPRFFLYFYMHIAMLLFYVYIQYTVYDPKFKNMDNQIQQQTTALRCSTVGGLLWFPIWSVGIPIQPIVEWTNYTV